MNGGQVSSNYLQAFEKDMNSLRRVSESLFVSVIKMIFLCEYSQRCTY